MYIKADDYSLNDLLHIIKIWANPGLFFVYFRPFINPPSIIINRKSVDGVLGFQTWSHRIVGADQTTEIWRPPYLLHNYVVLLAEIIQIFHITSQKIFVAMTASTNTNLNIILVITFSSFKNWTLSKLGQSLLLSFSFGLLLIVS